MTLHKPTGNWQLGLGLSLVTVAFWGVLPLALKLVLESVDAVTLTWFRFLIAAAFVAITLGRRKSLPSLLRRGWRSYGLMTAAMLGLFFNYLFFQMGLEMTTPATAQVLIQLSPMLFLLCSVVIFHERLTLAQIAGLITLFVGLGLFFHHRLGEFDHLDGRYALGVGCILLAGVTWAAYALAQKQLLSEMTSPSIMLVIYAGSALLASFGAHPSKIIELDALRVGLLIFAALNTIIAYGAFAEALAHWEAARVSAVLALTPILTLISVQVGHALWPDIVPSEELPLLSYVGAGLVVAGSMVASLSRRSRITKPPEWRAESQPSV